MSNVGGASPGGSGGGGGSRAGVEVLLPAATSCCTTFASTSYLSLNDQPRLGIAARAIDLPVVQPHFLKGQNTAASVCHLVPALLSSLHPLPPIAMAPKEGAADQDFDVSPGACAALPSAAVAGIGTGSGGL